MTLGSSVEPADVARFAAIADEWWDPKGKFAPLHRLNPARLAFIRDACLAHFDRDAQVRAPFSGLRLLDIGCGGGLVAEPMTRLGFEVTAIDAAPESLAVAKAHARGLGLTIDYRAATVEQCLEEAEAPFDVILALEVVEHVVDPGTFLSDCARLLGSGGLMIVATLNRTIRSLALAKIAAEYVLRWVPAGTHDWRKFLTPDELCAHLAAAGLEAGALEGLVLDPVRGVWRLSRDTDINFMMAASRPLAAIGA